MLERDQANDPMCMSVSNLNVTGHRFMLQHNPFPIYSDVLYCMYFSHSFEMYTFIYWMNVYIREPVEKKCGGLDWVIFHTFKNKIKKLWLEYISSH